MLTKFKMCGLRTFISSIFPTFGLPLHPCADVKKTQREHRKNLVGARVRRARRLLEPKVSQDDLSGRLARMGVTIDRTGISKVESYDRYVMDYEAAALAKALKVSVAWLYGEYN